jgi:hypothetical protein
MSATNTGPSDSWASGGWSSLPQQQHFSEGQGATGAAQAGGDPQAAVVAAMQAGAQNGNGQGAPTGAVQPQGQPVNQFYKGILEQVDPAHRAIVEPYLGKWDAGVTRRFQELHGELQPFQEIGADPETLAQAYQLYQAIDSNPQGVLEMLQQAMAEVAPPGAGGQQPQGPQGQQAPEGEGGAASLPPEFAEKFGQFEQALEYMAQQFLDQRNSQTAEAEDAQLDQYLGNLKREFGDFDEEYVVAKMMAGTSGEDAVKAYHAAIQQQVNSRSRQPNLPPILGGGGAVPQEGKSVAEASNKDVKALVANILHASNAQ